MVLARDKLRGDATVQWTVADFCGLQEETPTDRPSADVFSEP